MSTAQENPRPHDPIDVLQSMSPDVLKAAGTFFEELADRSKGLSRDSRNEEPAPKTWFADPFALLDSIGMGYRNAPTYLTYDTMRQVSERETFTAAIILTRQNQIATFARPQPNRYSVGFAIKPRFGDKDRLLSDSEKRRAEIVQQFIMNTGLDENHGRDSFETFLRKMVRDTLTYDQCAYEKTPTRSGRLHSFFMTPSDTIRTAQPRILKGTPPTIAELKKDIRYCQVINAAITTEYTPDQLAWNVRNPRTHVKAYGYGLPEIEMLITTLTAHLWAEEWNRKAFSQGSTIKGILNIKGNVPQIQLENFKRQFFSQVAGVQNAWKTPVLNGDEIQWEPMQMSNVEMGYQMWMEYLCKVTCAVYQIDPAEINFDLRGGTGQQPVFMSQNDAQQKVSKDRGLRPLLHFIQDSLNRHIVQRIDPEFEFMFVGMDAKTEEQAMQLRLSQVTNIYTLNEVRAMEGLPPVDNGDLVLNPAYIAAVQASQMQAQAGQQAQAAAPGGQPQAQATTPNQPYAGRFQEKPTGKEEERGADRLRQFDEKPDHSSGVHGSTEESSLEAYLPLLHREDWSSTVHASAGEPDLKKGLERFFDLDV